MMRPTASRTARRQRGFILALGMLMLLKEKAEAAGKKVRLAQCHGYAKELLTVANFQSKFPMD